MKKKSSIISFTICMLMIILQTNMILAIDSTSNETLTSVQETLNSSKDTQGTPTVSEISNTSTNQEQIDRDETLSQPNTSNNPLLENPRQQSPTSPENHSDLSALRANTDTTTENIIVNSLPEMPSSKEPDTLGKIIGWWLDNPLEMKFWFLFLILSSVLFLFKQTSFRKPLLFICLIIFGFYLGNTVNPINSIFSIPVQTGGRLIDSIVLIALPIILSLFIGRFFCGWACPIGAVQEFLHPENFAIQLPSLMDRIFSYFRFVLLIGGIIFSWFTMSNVWNSYDPFQGFFTLKWSLTTAVLLSILLISSVFIERFFCRYLCPLGALLAITSRLSIFKMRPDSEVCIACGKCSQPGACPTDTISALNPYTDLPQIKTSECIVCHRCTNVCRYSALKLSFSKIKGIKPGKNQNSGQNLTS